MKNIFSTDFMNFLGVKEELPQEVLKCKLEDTGQDFMDFNPAESCKRG
jgi:hypothetical protein